jgi:hypothetical protein
MILYLPSEDDYPRCGKEYKDAWIAWHDEFRDQNPIMSAACEAYADSRREQGKTLIGDVYGGLGNHDHKFDVSYENIVAAMEDVPGGWDLVQFEHRNQGTEYSLFFVFLKL